MLSVDSERKARARVPSASWFHRAILARQEGGSDFSTDASRQDAVTILQDDRDVRG